MKSQHRIIIIGCWPPPSGGVASYTTDLYYNLLNMGFEVNVYATGNFTVSDNNIKKINLSPRNPTSFLLSLLRMFIEISRGSIIHTQSILTVFPRKYLFLFFFFLKKIKRCFLIETLHDATLIERYDQFSEKQKQLYFLIGRFINYLIVINDSLKDFCISIGIPEAKIVVISSLLPLNCLELEKDNVPLEFQKFSQKFKSIVVTSGAFIPLYDLKTVVCAFLRFSQKYQNSGLVILQNSFAIDDTYKKEILGIIKDKDNILLLKDVPREQVLSIFVKSDLFIRGAQFDSFGLSKVEAILMGAKVISTKAGITNFMEIYEYQNAESLLVVMQKALVIDNTKTDERKNYFQKLAIDNFNKIIDIYDSL